MPINLKMNMIKNYYILLLFLLLFSCSKYQKVLKSNDFNLKFEKAVLYYQDLEFNKALPLFNELQTIMIGTSKIEDVSYYLANCHYSTGDYLTAAYLFKRFTQNYPYSKYTEECSFMSAYCYYLESPNYSLDPTNNYKAIKELQQHINQYPNSDKILECNTLIDELREKLSKKDFENAKQYFKTENYKSAIIALQNFLIDFPTYENREEVHYLIVRSSYLLAINSISTKIKERLELTVDTYNQFSNNYPESKYLKMLEETFNKTNESLKKIKNNTNEI